MADKWDNVDLTQDIEEQEIPKEHLLLAAVPVYGGRVPAVAKERLKRLRGQGGQAVALVVYGNRAYDDALLELKEILEEAGFQVIAAAAFIAEHSIARSIAAGRPDAQDLEKARQFGKAAAEKAQEDSKPVSVPGNPDYSKKKPGGAISPSVDKTCTQCKTCASACPVGAISMDEPGKSDAALCIGCMKCVSLCPQKARDIPKPARLSVQAFLKMSASKRREPEIFV